MLAALLVLAVTPAAGAGQVAPRDRRDAQSGTASIAGIVVGPDGRPLRRAQVRLSGDAVPEGVATTTDASGRWRFEGLAPGRYRAWTSKGGYIPPGRRQLFTDQGRGLDLSDGQRLTGITLTLARGAVVTGRVVDEFGDPVTDAQVMVLRRHFVNGRMRLLPGGRPATTDDLGQFRVYGLAAGTYYLSAAYRAHGGHESADREGYAPTYYPGTANPALAHAVPLAAGAEQAGLVIALQPVQTVTISGTAFDSQGRPATEGHAMLFPSGREEAFTGFVQSAGGQLRQGGAFTLSGVVPGEYRLMVRLGDAEEVEAGTMPISVGPEDLTGLVVTTSRGTVLSGQVVFDAPPGDEVRPGDIHVFAQPAEPDELGMGFGGRPQVRDDWTFEIRAFDSPVFLRTAGPPRGFRLKAVYLNGVDVTDDGLSFRPGEAVTGLQILMTASQTLVSGTVLDGAGAPAAGTVVLVFPDDPKYWTFTSRYRGQALPDRDGKFELRNLPAGRYLAAAVPLPDDGGEQDPALLERLRPLATAFTLQDGGQQALTLRLVEVR